MGLAIITALSLGFSGCATNNKIAEIGYKKYSISGEVQGRAELFHDLKEFCNEKKLYPKILNEKKTSEVHENYAPDMAIDFKCITETEYKKVK